MKNLKDILKNRRFKSQESTRPINNRYEVAREFGDYVGIPAIPVMRLFKLYGMEKVLGIRSWLYDIPFDPAKGGKIALANWKLKQNDLVCS